MLVKIAVPARDAWTAFNARSELTTPDHEPHWEAAPPDRARTRALGDDALGSS